MLEVKKEEHEWRKRKEPMKPAKSCHKLTKNMSSLEEGSKLARIDYCLVATRPSRKRETADMAIPMRLR